MKVIWSDFAKEMLKEIFLYHKDIAGKKIAHKLKSVILESTKHLKTFPDSGQIEESLKCLKKEHRYIVSGNYKIIYKKVKEGVLITDIFDTRQDPSKILH